jgi:hypothetical protein
MSTVTSPIHREPELLGQTVVVMGGNAGIRFETARRARAECGPCCDWFLRKTRSAPTWTGSRCATWQTSKRKSRTFHGLAAELRRISECRRGDCGLSHYLRRFRPAPERRPG